MEDVKELVKDAQRICVAIGEDMTDDVETQDGIYLKLSELLRGRDYFIVSMKTDDRIYRFFPGDENKIATPLGNRLYIQCPDGCEEALYEVTKDDETGITHYNKNGQLITEAKPLCPVCGKEMVYNTYRAPVFLEEGCEKGWNAYNTWLSRTLNRRLVFLELECGLKHPEAARWPFEKVTMLNEKARLLRVHKSLSMLPQESAEKGLAFAMDTAEFLENYL